MSAPTTAGAPPAGAAPAGRFDRRLILPMVLGAVLNPINSSIIAVSLVPIGRAFGTPASTTVWLISGLYVATAIGQPVVGRLVDLFGARRLFLAATALTGLAGLLGTLAPSFPMLVVARVVLGFGTCAGYPAAMTLIRSEADRTGEESPSGVLTVLAVSSQTVAVIGPTLGGLLIGVGGWRATFAINLPLAVLAFAAGWRWLPRPTAYDAPGGGGRGGREAGDATRSGRPGLASLDLPGMGLFAAVLVPLTIVLLDLRWSFAPLLLVSVLAAALLLRRERRVAAPFLDLGGLGDNRPLLRTYLRGLTASTVSYCVLYGYTQWLEDGRGLSAPTAGLLLLPLSLTALGVSAATGRRPEIRAKLVVGAGVQLAFTAAFLLLGPHTAIWLLVLLGAVCGIPQGLNNLANQNAVYYQASATSLGASAGLLRTAMYLGAMVASAATGAFFGRTADTAGLHGLAIFLVGVAVVSLLLAVLDSSIRRAAPVDPAAESESPVPASTEENR